MNLAVQRHAVATVAAVKRSLPDVTSVLTTAWNAYKSRFIQADGRVIDPMRAGVSTSEGQSYAMLRAVWMNDQTTFVSSWRWATRNLQVRGDHLFAYLWGRHNEQWAVIDKHSASDADEDIALALIFASHRWHAVRYLRAAKGILNDIWSREVATVAGQPYLAAGDWAAAETSPGPVLNPSYFAPYSYRIFSSVDTSHPWMNIVSSSYRALAACTWARLGGSRSAGLPPDWCALNRRTGQAVTAPYIARSTMYAYDAFRTMWRTAIDWLWNGSPQAQSYLRRVIFLRRRWEMSHRLFATYAHDGNVLIAREDPTVYGGDIGDLLVTDPTGAEQMSRDKLLASYQHDSSGVYFGQPDNYYEQNWVWFGLALAGNRLLNLAS